MFTFYLQVAIVLVAVLLSGVIGYWIAMRTYRDELDYRETVLTTELSRQKRKAAEAEAEMRRARTDRDRLRRRMRRDGGLPGQGALRKARQDSSVASAAE